MIDSRTSVYTDRILRGLIVFLVIAFVVLAGPFIASAVLEKAYESTRESELRYTFTITTSSALSEVNLFIPLPTDGEGLSPIIQMLGSGDQSVTFEGYPVSIYGANNESYLKVSTNLLPGPSNTTDARYFFSVVAASPALHTRLPVQYDYTLLPKRNLIEVPCGADLCSGQPLCFQYQSLIYVSYHTSLDTRVEIQADLLGTNRWRILQGYRNEYADNIDVILQGPVSGWYAADGNLVTSCGDKNPFWRERVEDTVRTRNTSGVDTSMMRWHTFTPLP
jgi:hypothetical protein